MDKVYTVTMQTPFGIVEHKFSAESKELAARSAKNKYPVSYTHLTLPTTPVV